ncbi:unnamed protein product [Moneuplotes crassus]|uniref:RING-type domain-containing protein n=1 Tax=Euplotes crassus TaxID=5936 RepID=A0AAD1XR38_EUPCR|nr:unnamed protein product [Moneuplotes crassus]
MENYDSCDDLDICDEGTIAPTYPSIPLMMNRRKKINFHCYKCERRFQAYPSTRCCPRCEDEFIEEISDDRNEESKEESKGFPDPFEFNNRITFNGNGFISTIIRNDSGPDSPEADRFRLIRFPLQSDMEFFPNRRRENRSIFANGSGLGPRSRPSFRQIDNIFERLLRNIMMDSPNRQKPATKDAIDNLKTIDINNNDAINQSIEEKEAPNCCICTDDIESKANILPCKHLFHPDCIKKWLKIHHACPICRSNID